MDTAEHHGRQNKFAQTTQRLFRLVSFDGGGVHAASYLPVIARLEGLLGTTLAESGEFGMFAGTSTGAIVATALKMNTRAEEIAAEYQRLADVIFRKASLWHRPFFTYASEPLRDELARFYRRRLGLQRDITWKEFSTRSAYPGVELVVVLWDITHERPTYLSTNLDRPGQAEPLWGAAVADVITACCSAPTYFPPRSFKVAQNEYAFCDGGITGLNTPGTFAMSLVHGTLPTDSAIHVISFGAGEARRRLHQGEAAVENRTWKLSAIRNWSVLSHAKATVNALFYSTTYLMNQFYPVFGSSLRIERYLRTNHFRDQRSQLDDASAIGHLAGQFARGELYYDLWATDESPSDTRAATLRHLAGQPSPDELGQWEEIWETYFGLKKRHDLRRIVEGEQAPLIVDALAAPDPATKFLFDVRDDPETRAIASGEVRPNLRAYVTAPAIVTSIASLVLFVAALIWTGWLQVKRLETVALIREAQAVEQNGVFAQINESSAVAAGKPISDPSSLPSVGLFRKAAALYETAGDDRGRDLNILRQRLAGLAPAFEEIRTGTVQDMAISNDGSYLVAGWNDGSVIGWTTDTFDQCLSLDSPDPQGGRAFVIDGSTQNLAVWQLPTAVESADPSVHHSIDIYEMKGGLHVKRLVGESVPRTVDIVGGRCMAVSADGQFTVWDIAEGTELRSGREVSGAALGRAGFGVIIVEQYIAHSASTNTFLGGAFSRILRVPVLGNGPTETLVDDAGAVDDLVSRMNDLNDGREWEKHRLACAVWPSPDRRFMVYSNWLSGVRALDTETGKHISIPADVVFGFSSTGKRLYFQEDGQIGVVDAETGQRSLSEISIPGSPTFGQAFNESQYRVFFAPAVDGRWCVTFSPACSLETATHLRLWDVPSGHLICQIPLSQGWSVSGAAAFARVHDAQSLVVVASGGVVRAYNVALPKKYGARRGN
jgi:patatin-like phospholipase/acyl hydrolase/WD40 repeat protein